MKGLRDEGIGRWPCAAHILNGVIKRVVKKFNDESLNTIPKILRVMKCNPPTVMEMEKKKIKKINDYPETRWGYIYLCVKDILDAWDKIIEIKDLLSKKVDSGFFKETVRLKLFTFKIAVEPLFFALEFLQTDKLNISSYCCFFLGIIAELETLSLSNVFAAALLNEMETVLETVNSVSFGTLSAVLDPFFEIGWMSKDLADKCWDTIKVMAYSYQPQEKSDGNAITALMRCSEAEIGDHCDLVRAVIETQRGQEHNIGFKELFQRWKEQAGGDFIEQNQTQHDQKLLEFWSGLTRASKAASCLRVAQVVLSCPVTSASSERQFSYSKPYARKNISPSRFSTLAFAPPAKRVATMPP